MGKVGLLAFVAAVITILDSMGVLSKWHGAIKIAVYGILAVFGGLLFLFDLIRFFDSAYPLRTRIIDVVLSTFLGDYFEQHRCWFNWKLNLYDNQFFAREVLFDRFMYPVLCVLNSIDDPEAAPIPTDTRNFGPRTKISRRTDHTWVNARPGLEDDWGVTGEQANQLRYVKIGWVCFRFFTIGDCLIKLRVKIESVTEYKCFIQIHLGGNSKPLAEYTECLTERVKVQTLFDFFSACAESPKTGVIDIRRGGLHRGKKTMHSFRIQDALNVMKDNRCALFNCQHLDHSLWVL